MLYLAFCEFNNVYHYPPYAFAIYTKILVGIAYQASIFDLKYIVRFYFNSDKMKLDEITFQ